MLSGSWARYAPLAGLLAVALLIASVVIGGDSVDADDPVGKVVAFWTVNEDDQRLAAILGALSLIPLVWFLGSLFSTLRRAEGDSGRLSATAFGGGLVLVSFAAVDSALQFAAADSVGDVPPYVTQTLSVLYGNFWFGFAIGQCLLMLAAALVILRTGVLPAWLGWVALVVGIASVTPVGFFAFPVLGLWIAIVSVVLFRRESAPPASTGDPGPGRLNRRRRHPSAPPEGADGVVSLGGCSPSAAWLRAFRRPPSR